MSAEVESPPVEPLVKAQPEPEVPAASAQDESAKEVEATSEDLDAKEPERPIENGEAHSEPAVEAEVKTDIEIAKPAVAENLVRQESVEVKPPPKPGKPAKPAPLPKTKPPPKPQRLSQSMSNGSATSPTDEKAAPASAEPKPAEKPTSLSLMDEIMGAMMEKGMDVEKPKTPQDEVGKVDNDTKSPVVDVKPASSVDPVSAKTPADETKAPMPKPEPTPPPKPAVKSKPAVKPKVLTPATPEKPKPFLKSKSSDLSKSTGITIMLSQLPTHSCLILLLSSCSFCIFCSWSLLLHPDSLLWNEHI